MNCGLVCLNTLRQKFHSSRANELGYSPPVLSSSRKCTLDLLKLCLWWTSSYTGVTFRSLFYLLVGLSA